MSKRLTFVGLCSLLSACHQPESSEPKVIGGQLPTSDYSFFVALQDQGSEGGGFCGGALLAPDVVEKLRELLPDADMP